MVVGDGAGSWMIMFSSTQRKQRKNWGKGEAINSESPPSVSYFLQQGPLKGSLTSLNSATNWVLHIQISEPVGNIS